VRRADHSGSDVSGGIISSSLDDRNSSILSLRDPIKESSLPWNAPRLAARSIMLTACDRSWYEMVGMVGSSDMVNYIIDSLGGMTSSSFLEIKNACILMLISSTISSSLPLNAPRPAAIFIRTRAVDK